jgi:beta-N-acetylhexosaminidase
MKSISNNFSFEEAVELALLAGNDILLFANQIDYSENLPQKFIKIVLEIIKQNKISVERINNSFERIIYYKNQIMLN